MKAKTQFFRKKLKQGWKRKRKTEVREKWKKQNKKKPIKNKVHFLPFLKNSHTCNYYMHEKPKICPESCNMHHLHINKLFFFSFTKTTFSDCFQSFSLSFSFLTYFFCSFLYAKPIFFQVNQFSKITSIHTSMFENLWLY